MPKIWRVVLIALFIIISGAGFPIYNFGKHYAYVLTGIMLFVNIACYLELGVFENKILNVRKISHAALMNLGIILSGMLCRYLLEWGEISNVYNFTMPNMLVHIAATFTISTLSYLLVKNKS